MSEFNPYHQWLGISETARPISKYRLLAIDDFEDNRDVISAAAERQTIYLRTLQAGEHAVLVAELLNEVSQARVTLLSADQKAEYDEELRKQQAPEPVPEPTPPPIPVVQTLVPLQNTPLTGLFTGREPITQNRPQSTIAEWSTFEPDKRPRRRQKEIWKRPALVGICLVGTIVVFVLLISLMSTGDAEPVASNTGTPISAERDVEAAVAEKIAAEKIAAEKIAAEKIAAEKIAAEKIAAEKAAMEKAAAITAALATGDWKAVLALDADNSEGLLMQVAAEKAAMEKAAAEKATILVGDPITDTLNMTFNKIPAGTFLMGSPEKYKAILDLGADPAEQRIIDELDNETRMTFVNTPLKDVLNTIKSSHRIPIIIDVRALVEKGMDINSLYVTVDLKGISFRTGLKQILNNLSLTYVINDEVLKILTPEAARKETTYDRQMAEQAAGQIAFLSNEHQHEVIINKAFYMQTTEVTQSQWTAVMGSEPWKGGRYVKEDSDYPATNVSWDDAVVFSKKLSEKEGETYRLPTEAEWEYACRAGAETRWSFGDDEKAVGDYAWYRGNAWDIDEWYAHQVGLKKPNPFGLYDMHGNVWEWCHDPSFHTSGFFRVLRGGSWYHFMRSSRSARRHWVDAGHRSSLHGFRVVRELDDLQERGLLDDTLVITLSEFVRTRAEKHRSKPVVRTLEGHASYVNSVAFSPDGKILASGSDDETIKLWDIKTGVELKTLTGHSDKVGSVIFSPDGRRLATSTGTYKSTDNTIRIWNIETGVELKTLRGNASSVAFSPDGKIIASGGSNGTVKLWDSQTGAEIKTLTDHTDSVSSVAFSPDGKILASGHERAGIILWDIGTGAELKTLEGHSGDVLCVAFSPDGKTIASGGVNDISLLNSRTGRKINTLLGMYSSINYSIAFSPDGKTIASGRQDSTIVIFDSLTGEVVKTLGNLRRGSSEGHSDRVSSVAFSPDGKTIASGSSDKTVKLWYFDK